MNIRRFEQLLPSIEKYENSYKYTLQVTKSMFRYRWRWFPLIFSHPTTADQMDFVSSARHYCYDYYKEGGH